MGCDEFAIEFWAVRLYFARVSDRQTNSLEAFARRHWPVGVVLALLAVFYWGFLQGTSFIWEDGLNTYYPETQYFCVSVLQGRFPLWFNGVSCGVPFYSDPQMLGFYPITWLMIPFVKDGTLPFVVYQRFLVRAGERW